MRISNHTPDEDPLHDRSALGNGGNRNQPRHSRPESDFLFDNAPDAGAEAAVRECAAWMAARHDEVVTAIMRRIARSVPAYECSIGHPAERQNLRTNVETVVCCFMAALISQRLTTTEIRPIESIAAQRAMDGFSLDAIREAIHMAVDEGHSFLHGALLEAGPDTTVLTAAHAIARLVGHFEFEVQRAIEAGYRRVQDQRIASETRAQDVLVRRALEGTLDGARLGPTRSDALSASPLNVVVILPRHGVEDMRAVADPVARGCAGRAEGPIPFTTPVHHAAFILHDPRPDDPRLLDALARDCDAVLIVEGAVGLADAARAYALGRDLLPFAPREPRSVPAVSLLHLPLFLAGSRKELIEYISRTLENVFADGPAHGATCLETLLAYYCSPGSQVQQTAQARCLNPRTVSNHLKRVENLTGCDRYGDRLRLEIAVRAWDHLRHQPVQPGDPPWLHELETSADR